MVSQNLKLLHIQKAEIVAGCENHLLTLLPDLRDRGYDVTMLALTPPHRQDNPFVQQMRSQGIPTLVLPIRGKVDWQILPRLFRLIRQGNYSLVHTHLIHADFYGAIAARLAGVPVVCSTRHNDDAFRRHPLLRWLLRWNAHCFDALICISKHVQQFTATVESAPRDRLWMIPYGISVLEKQSDANWRAQMGWDEQTPVLGNVARLTAQKGQHTLLQAMPQVLKSFPQTQLVIVGDGELRQPLQQLADTLNVSAHIHFLGYQANAIALMPQFDVLAHPSLWEGFGLVLLEAMAAKRPIVATNVSAIPEIVLHGETGLLVPPENPTALAEAICRILRDRSLGQKLGLAGYQRLQQHFTVQAMSDRTYHLYTTLFNSQQQKKKIERQL
jgi:glycosyltransferase involved in cell wall biosynthesis